MARSIRVVAALIERSGRVLLDRRRPGSHLEHRWEFPGGKCEPGETDEQALRRELREELGVDATVDGPAVASVHHAYEAFEIDLVLYPVTLHGEPTAVDVDAIDWFERATLPNLSMPPADRPLVEAVLMGRHRPTS